MRQHLLSFRVMFVIVMTGGVACLAQPKPSPYPVTWEFKFTYGPLRRVTVNVPGSTTPQPFWYMTYTVTNNTDQERVFLPVFEMMTKDGRIHRSDKNIPAVVFDVIKSREKIRFLEPYPKIAGELRLGEDQARDGVAIWPEPMPEMGEFSIFVGSLSGEAVIFKDSKGEPVKDAEGKPIILRKTLQINYLMRGDELYPGKDKVEELSKEWVMR
jgi:hypothetical protein